MRICTIFVVLLALAGCRTAGEAARPGLGPVEQSWLFARVVIPAKRLWGPKPMQVSIWADPDHWVGVVHHQLRVPEDRMPAAIYLHGCLGLGPEAAFVDFLVQQGFAVFAPNSFGRRGRRAACYAQEGTPIFDWRAEELAFALARLREISWIDARRIVLVGQSEGGEAAANWAGTGFHAVVVSGANCSLYGPAGEPATPAHVPVLAVVGDKDHREHPGCRMEGRPAPSRSVIIADSGHAVYASELGRQVIAGFLKACCGG